WPRPRPRRDARGRTGDELLAARRSRHRSHSRDRVCAPSRPSRFDTESARRYMTSPASVGGNDRLRLFLALQLPGHVLDVLERWQAAQLGKGRLVAREALHVTLAFLGSPPSSQLPPIPGAPRGAAA